MVILPMSKLNYSSCYLMLAEIKSERNIKDVKLAESKSEKKIKDVKFYLVIASESNVVALIIAMYQSVTSDSYSIKGSQEEIG